MQATDAKARLIKALKTLNTEMLKEVIALVFASKEDGSESVLVYALNELETRVPEQEFASFCEAFSA